MPGNLARAGRNAANIKAAKTDLKTIREEIAAGTFSYAKWFPNSAKVKTGAVPKATGARALTLGEAIADFRATKARLSKNTQKLYRNAGEVWKTIFGAETTLADLTPTKVETTVGLKALGSARRAYNTRHTYASLRLSMGADVYYVSKQLGHKNITTTMKTYALYIDGAKMEAGRVRELMSRLRAKATAEAAVPA